MPGRLIMIHRRMNEPTLNSYNEVVLTNDGLISTFWRLAKKFLR